MTEAIAPAEPVGFSKHRLEALTDGIFAVAMTLLVIELKVPAHGDVQSAGDLVAGVFHLTPKFIAWMISFFVLAIFWFTHHRLFHYIRAVDTPLLWLNIVYLSFVSLMPFSSALSGDYVTVLFTQGFYSTNMILFAAAGLAQLRYVYHHPGLWKTTITPGFYRASRFRTLGLVAVALIAIGIAVVLPGAGNAAFTLMIPISVLSRRIERKG